MTTAPAPRKRPLLIYPAALLSLASLAWTTWSLVDLLGTGTIGVTVAVGADIIWGAVIIAEARGVRIANRAWTVPAFGWAALLVVAAFLAWHGIARDSLALAAAGPFLPLGAKTVWALALADMRDPAALTVDELHQLAAMERGMAFEEQQHRIEMRRRAMSAERQMTEVSADFDIELMRQDKARELHRRRPLELESGDVSAAPSAPETSPGHAAGQDTGHTFPMLSGRTTGHGPHIVSAAPDITAKARSGHGADTPLASPDTVRRPTVRTVPNKPADSPADNPADKPGPSVSAIIRRVLDSGIEDPDKILAAVRDIHPDAKADTVRRTTARQRNTYL